MVILICKSLTLFIVSITENELKNQLEQQYSFDEGRPFNFNSDSDISLDEVAKSVTKF